MMTRLLAASVVIAGLAGLVPSVAGAAAQDRYCLQGRPYGYPGNCQFSSYQQCMASASGTDAYCGRNPQYSFARQRQQSQR